MEDVGERPLGDGVRTRVGRDDDGNASRAGRLQVDQLDADPCPSDDTQPRGRRDQLPVDNTVPAGDQADRVPQDLCLRYAVLARLDDLTERTESVRNKWVDRAQCQDRPPLIQSRYGPHPCHR